MWSNTGWCNKTSTSKAIFIVTPSLKGWPTKAKETPSPHEVRLNSLDTKPVFQRKALEEDLYDAYEHVICTSELYSRGNYLETITSHSMNHKQQLLWYLSLMKFAIHTLILMRNCRLMLTLMMFFYWKLTIEFVRKTCKYFSYCPFETLYSCFG